MGDNNICAHQCTNTPGSFFCECNDGFRLAANGRSCSGKHHETYLSFISNEVVCTPDIDECDENTDSCSQTCENTVGSFICSCSPGYQLNSNGISCDGMWFTFSLYTYTHMPRAPYCYYLRLLRLFPYI